MKQKKSVHGLILIGLLFLVPAAASAAGVTDVTSGLSDFGSIITAINTSIVRSLITLFATAAMAAFFFGIVQFIWGTRDADSTRMKNGKNFMLWGMIALFVMFSVWGIITYVQTIFKIEGRTTIIIPSIQLEGASSGGTNSPLQNGSGASPSYYCQSSGAVFVDYNLYQSQCQGASGGTSGGASGGGATGGGSYACSPGYECTLPGGGIGLCSVDGRSCVSNQVGGYPCDPQDPSCEAGSSSVDCTAITSSSACNAQSVCEWSNSDLSCNPR